jgi:O-antigen/teichoic acid export membrane protein
VARRLPPDQPRGDEPAPPLSSGGAGPLARAAAFWRHGWSLVRLGAFDESSADGRSKERYRRIALTTLAGVVARGVSTLAGLVTVPLVLAALGKERYAVWAMITTSTAWLGLFDFGVANGLVNALSEAHGRDDQQAAARHVSTALALLSALGLLFALGSLAAAPRIDWSALFASQGALDEATTRAAVLAALVLFAASLPLSTTPLIYAGYQRTYLAHLFAVGGTLAGLLLLLAALQVGAALPWLVLASGAASLLATALALAFAFARWMPWLRPRPGLLSAGSLRSLLRRSVPLFLYQVGALAVSETQSLILAHRCDLAAVADYALGMRLYLFLLGLVQMSTSSFVTPFRESVERGDHAWARASFGHFVRLRVALAAGAGLALFLWGNLVLRLWLRRPDVAFSTATWAALAAVLVATAWASAHADLLAIMDRLWVLVALVLANGAATLALSWALAPGLRVLGVVIAFGAVTVLVYSWLVPALAQRLLPPRTAPR